MSGDLCTTTDLISLSSDRRDLRDPRGKFPLIKNPDGAGSGLTNPKTIQNSKIY